MWPPDVMRIASARSTDARSIGCEGVGDDVGHADRERPSSTTKTRARRSPTLDERHDTLLLFAAAS